MFRFRKYFYYSIIYFLNTGVFPIGKRKFERRDGEMQSQIRTKYNSASLCSKIYSEGIKHLIMKFFFSLHLSIQYYDFSLSNKNPASTLFPSAAYISSTTPSSAASIVFSIFIEEMMTKPSPDLTSSPSLTSTLII